MYVYTGKVHVEVPSRGKIRVVTGEMSMIPRQKKRCSAISLGVWSVTSNGLFDDLDWNVGWRLGCSHVTNDDLTPAVTARVDSKDHTGVHESCVVRVLGVETYNDQLCSLNLAYE